MTTSTPSTPGGVNMAIVALLLDCQNFGPEAWTARELRHEDGRPFTEDEHQLVGQARRPELQAVRDYFANAALVASEHAEHLRQLAALVQPYMERFGPGTTVADVRALMPPEERARLDELVALASDATVQP
ncbi:hypothetical protein ACIBBG_16420 [Micromonospora chersina]|uniref:hypothetical protein n=1 Tax=Micromonospora chersina TaxID=47854 RepID=UPI0037AEF38D